MTKIRLTFSKAVLCLQMLYTVMTTENWPWHPDLTVATTMYFHGNDMERTHQMVTDTVLA